MYIHLLTYIWGCGGGGWERTYTYISGDTSPICKRHLESMLKGIKSYLCLVQTGHDENKYNHTIHNFNIFFIITGKYIIYKIQVQCNYTILLLYFQLRPKIICINWIIPYICFGSYHQWKSLHFQLIRECIDCFIWSTTFLYIWHTYLFDLDGRSCFVIEKVSKQLFNNILHSCIRSCKKRRKLYLFKALTTCHSDILNISPTCFSS